ncbi:MAG: hypothetical protein K1X28_09575 [Parachlamydiales bacterium]|nr:hypothetical protein [Parachlamydiales bacterium]
MSVQNSLMLPAETSRSDEPDLESGGKKEKKKEYHPLRKRIACLAGLELIAGCASSFILPRISLPPTFIPLVMAPFIDGFSKSGKNFLKSLGSLAQRAMAASAFVGSAIVWDLMTTQDPTQAKNWGLTALMIAVLAKDVANRVAAYQKPLKE